MKKIALAAAVVLVLAPALARAQSRGSVQVQSSTSASVSTQSGLSADAQAQVEANVRAARERKLPEQPIRQRVAEGEAKGASEATIVMASGRVLAELQTSHDAMVQAGRTSPSNDEVARGAQLVARGFTSAQLEAVVRRAPADRSLVVAFETLTSLQARGVSTTRAVSQVESKLASRASDAELRQLALGANGSAQADGALGVGRGAGNVAGSASGGANVAGSAAGVAGSAAAGAGAAATGALGHGAAGVAGGATGAVGGVLGHRP